MSDDQEYQWFKKSRTHLSEGELAQQWREWRKTMEAAGEKNKRAHAESRAKHLHRLSDTPAFVVDVIARLQESCREYGVPVQSEKIPIFKQLAAQIFEREPTFLQPTTPKIKEWTDAALKAQQDDPEGAMWFLTQFVAASFFRHLKQPDNIADFVESYYPPMGGPFGIVHSAGIDRYVFLPIRRHFSGHVGSLGYTLRPDIDDKLKEARKAPHPPTAFFKGTIFEPLYPMPELPTLKPLPADLHYSGTWIIATQGKGKTTLLRSLIVPRLNENCSIIIFDSKNDLANTFLNRKLPKPVVTIGPDPYLAINPMSIGTRAVGTMMYMFSAILEAKLTGMQSVPFRMALQFCTHIPNANMGTLRDVIANGASKYSQALDQLDDEDKSFWIDEFETGTYTDTRKQILWRLNLLRPSGSVFRSMFNSPTTKVKMQPLMDTNTVTVINNQHSDWETIHAEFFSRMFLAMILGAAEQRAKLPDDKKYPCYVFIDEAQTVVAREPATADIIQRCRSQKIALVCAHHNLAQLEDPKVESALGDCAIKYTNPDSDASKLAVPFQTTADNLRNLGVGEFAVAARGQPTVNVKIIPPDLSIYPLLSAAELSQRAAEIKAKYHYIPGTAAVAGPKESGSVNEW